MIELEAFKDLLQKTASIAFIRRNPNFQAQKIAKLIAEDNLEDIEAVDLQAIFTDAGRFFRKIYLPIPPPAPRL